MITPNHRYKKNPHHIEGDYCCKYFLNKIEVLIMLFIFP